MRKGQYRSKRMERKIRWDFWDSNGSPNSGQMTRSRSKQKEFMPDYGFCLFWQIAN